MNRLQKRAWISLAVTTLAVIISSIGVGLAVYLNAKGVAGLMSFLIAGLIVGLVSGLRSIAAESKFDERERKIAIRAFIYSSYTFIIFICFASFTIFFIVGARGHTPAYVFPVLFLAGLFISQFVESATILIRFTREQIDGE